MDAAQDLDERPLAAAVLADEGVDLARAQVERAVTQRLGGAERLRQVLDAEEKRPGRVRL